MPAGGDIIYVSDLNGLIADASLTADTATWTATETGALLSVTASLISGKRYRIDFGGNISTDTQTFPLTQANAETVVMRIREDTATGTQMVGDQIPIYHNGTVGFRITTFAYYTAVATGNKTFVVTGQHGANGSSGNQRIRAGATRPAVLSVTQIKNA